MKRINLRAILFCSYTLILAILVTAYMGENTYLLNFYILPILFGAYYFDIHGGIGFVFVSTALSIFFMHKAGKPITDTPMITQIVIFSIVGIVAGIFQKENNRLNNYLLKASLTDKLTNLYNYGYFTKRITEEIARADRYKHPVALIMIDIDHFKQYNDTYGHQKGNQVLFRLSQIIAESARQSDIAFRYGGEEFCIILPETGEEAQKLAERLRQKVLGCDWPSNVKITISAGVSYHPYRSSERDIGLVERADRALYEAKGSGRNRACLYKG